MPKKIFKKTFSKIIFLIFIFSFIQIFIIKNNVSAYNVPTNGCSFSNATYTAYIISTSDLNGTLPLCFRDNDANNTLTLKTGDSFSLGTIISNPSGGNTFAGAATHTINYTKNFSGLVTDDITNFFLNDGVDTATAKYTLTLLPATIGMTVSTSTAGYNYNAAGTAITGSYNDKILPYLGPYQLKYGEQLNFSCDITTKMAVYSSAKNNTLPLLKDLSACNNYSSNQILKNRCFCVFIYFY